MRIGLLSTPTGPFLGYILRALNQRGIEVDSILLDAKDVGEKDRAIHGERTEGRLPPIALSAFETLRVPCFFVETHASELTAELIRARQLDLLINAGTPHILKSTTLDAARIGILNCHPGLLPGYRGCTCVEWAVFMDEQVGNTVHFMNEGIDEGPIVLQEPLIFSKSDRYVDVRLKVYRSGFELMARGVEKVIKDRLSPETLPSQGQGRYWRVIEDAKMREVVQKLSVGGYRYQL